jgi:ubiquinone/menaquinone biosynthesis C-methylase UbiE
MKSAWRAALLFGFFGLAAFVAGTRFVGIRPAPLVHPITQREIAGIATDRAWMDREGREQEEAPERALDLIGVREGMIVADIGAGSGYMTMKLARRVGPQGKVYANDVQPVMLQTIGAKAAAAHSVNVVTVLGTADDARLPALTIDVALLVDVYHEFRRPQQMLRSIHAALKPDGRLILIEYRKEDPRLPIAPTHRLSVGEARREIESEHYVFDHAIEDLPRQHILVFRP